MVKVLTAIIVLMGGLLFVPSTASAANETATFQAAKRGCVTRAEFRRVKRGMKKARVRRIFDTRGRFADGGGGGYSRVYRSCDFRHAAFIEYRGVRGGPDRTTGFKRWTGAS
jgi:hypothetical protein